MKYNVGDRVRIVRKWAKGAGVNHSGKMDKWLGSVMTIRKISGLYFMVEDQDENDGNGWAWSDLEIEGLAHKCNQKIVITTDGTETLARLYDGNKVVKSASAKCNPEDEFDFKFGANLAFERLMSEEKPKSEIIENPDATEKPKYEVGQYYRHDGRCGKGIFKVTKIKDNRVYYEIVEGMKDDASHKDFDIGSRFDKDTTHVTWNVVDRPVKKGDYVRIVRPSFGFNEVGDILKVHKPHGTGILVLNKNHPRPTCDYLDNDYEWCYLKEHFEVVELPSEKKSEPKPKTEPKPTFKEGDRVRHAEYGEGTVICLAEFGGYGVEFNKHSFLSHDCTPQKLVWGKRGTKGTSHWCKPEDLTLITENPKKQKYNGKVVCVNNAKNHNAYTVGKIYQFKDGLITDDNGNKLPTAHDIYTFDDWAKWTCSKFIEVVE